MAIWTGTVCSTIFDDEESVATILSEMLAGPSDATQLKTPVLSLIVAPTGGLSRLYFNAALALLEEATALKLSTEPSFTVLGSIDLNDKLATVVGVEVV